MRWLLSAALVLGPIVVAAGESVPVAPPAPVTPTAVPARHTVSSVARKYAREARINLIIPDDLLAFDPPTEAPKTEGRPLVALEDLARRHELSLVRKSNIYYLNLPAPTLRKWIKETVARNPAPTPAEERLRKEKASLEAGVEALRQLLEADSRPEIATLRAQAHRNFVEALVKEGFQREEAIQIAIGRARTLSQP